MGHGEYMEWMAFYAIDPWGEQRADMRMAKMTQATYTGPLKRPPDLSDLMLYPDGGRPEEDATEQTPEQIAAILSRMAGPRPKG